MGITLTAYVQIKPLMIKSPWFRLAKWSLGKDYGLMRDLRVQLSTEWPEDVTFRNLPEYDFPRYWWNCQIDAELIVDQSSPEWSALTAGVAILRETMHVRVLFLEV